jgi:uncharacterized membrane protein YgdD (TMEM256/DUF423 family)
MINTSARLFLLLGSLNMALVVMLGAFGAHGLKNVLSPAMLTVYQTGVHYHALHALGLLALAAVACHWPSSWLRRAAWWLLAGIILFSGSLYTLSISGVRALGMITPLGGMAFIIGWLMVVIGAWRAEASKS